MSNLHNQDAINQALVHLCTIDADIAQIAPKLGEIKVRKSPSGFRAFCDIIVSQQLSKKAADTIFTRFENMVVQINPENILKFSLDDYRSVGFSRPKAGYLLALARDVLNGDFNPDALPHCSDQEIIQSISARHGLGVWSAEIYAMFALGRMNIMPAGDLALQHGLRILKNLDEKPSDKKLRQLTNHWQPYLGVGALLLWQLYSMDKQNLPNKK